MSARKLAAYVYVPDKDGVSRGFGPGDAVPAWAERKITNPKAWADPDQETESEPTTLEHLADRVRTAGATDEMVGALADLDEAEVAALADLSDEDLRAAVERAHEDTDEDPTKLDVLADRARAAGATDEDVEQLAELDDVDVDALLAATDEDLQALIATAHAPGEGEGGSQTEIPPKGGPGSGIEAWQAYAADHEIEIPEGASREDIIAAVEAAAGE